MRTESGTLASNSANIADADNTASSTQPAPPRVAYFPDSFHEVNGVAHTSRNFEAFARRRNLPFLCIRAGDRTQRFIEEGNVWTLELPRGFLSFALEKDLRFDPAYLRHIPHIGEVLDRFRPDLIHITGPSEVGILGAWLSHRLGLPLAASWHTNVHEYAARRADWLLRHLPARQSLATGQHIEDLALAATAHFYSVAQVLFAPNPELCALLERSTGRRCHLMPRGVDAELFNPAKRQSPQTNVNAERSAPAGPQAPVSYQGAASAAPQSNAKKNGASAPAVLGFVGRLSVEKNIALLVDIEKKLIQNEEKIRFLIVGHGGDERWLRERLHRAEFTGVLRGEELARAYASMDLFVFPSHTDTFGNVVLEALASGVPAIVTPDGGPKTIVRDGVTGRIVPDDQFASAISSILADPVKHAAMRCAARAYAETASWDSVFEGVYAAYEDLRPAAHRNGHRSF